MYVTFNTESEANAIDFNENNRSVVYRLYLLICKQLYHFALGRAKMSSGV